MKVAAQPDHCGPTWRADPGGPALACHWLRSCNVLAKSVCGPAEWFGGAGEEGGELSGLRPCLSGVPDLERGVTRILHRTAAPSELLTNLQALSTLAADLRVRVSQDTSLTPVIQQPVEGGGFP